VGANPQDVDRWWYVAAKLFHEISADVGQDAARHIFKSFLPKTAKDERILKNIELLANYDSMPKRSVRKLARELSKKNETLPKELDAAAVVPTKVAADACDIPSAALTMSPITQLRFRHITIPTAAPTVAGSTADCVQF
jgi:hypothetical protein